MVAVLAVIPPLLTYPLEVFREVQDVSYDVRDLHIRWFADDVLNVKQFKHPVVACHRRKRAAIAAVVK